MTKLSQNWVILSGTFNGIDYPLFGRYHSYHSKQTTATSLMVDVIAYVNSIEYSGSIYGLVLTSNVT